MASGGRRRGKVKRKKKTRYLSLSRHLAKAVDAPESLPRTEVACTVLEEEPVQAAPEEGEKKQLDPFALQPEPSTLFAAAPSLTDILGASSSSGAGGGESSCGAGASPDDVSGRTGRFTGEEEDLARRALRGRERWVYCSGSSSPSAATTNTTTTSSPCSSAASTEGASRSPLLKLDYEEILAAWAGRGSLYIGGAAAADHAAPNLQLGSVFVEVGPSHHTAAWSAPGRAERVRRYREKRHARLFSKRIRYEVRRLNAVRRARFKGRFIKGIEAAAAMVDGGGKPTTS